MKTRLLLLAALAITGLWLYSTGVWLYHGHGTYHYGFWAPPSPLWSDRTSLLTLGPMLVLLWLVIRRLRHPKGWRHTRRSVRWGLGLTVLALIIAAVVGLPYFNDAALDFQECHGVDRHGVPCYWRNPLNRRFSRRQNWFHCQWCFEQYLEAEREERRRRHPASDRPTPEGPQ